MDRKQRTCMRTTGNELSRRDFLTQCTAAAGGILLSNRSMELRRSPRQPNILLITADDMNYNSVGIYGCGIPLITPNIDQFARQGMRFTHSHVTIAVCQPCRDVLMTGRYPHRNGAEGFEPIDDTTPTLQ